MKMKNKKGFALAGLCLMVLEGTAPVFAEVHYEGKGLRDPFTDPLDLTPTKKDTMDYDIQGAVSSLKLQGVLYGTQHPRAIINGKIYAIGDRLGAWKVTRVEKDNVVFSVSGKDYILKTTPRKMNHDFEPQDAPPRNS